MNKSELQYIHHFQKVTSWDSFGPVMRGNVKIPSNNKVPVKVINRNPSIREFSECPMTIGQLEQFCLSIYGIDSEGRSEVPSAGNMQSVKIEFVNYQNGDWYFPSGKRGLIKNQESIPKESVQRLVYNQLSGTPWLALLYADIKPYLEKYGLRSYRLIYLEAGHMCQLMIMESQKMGLSSCALGAFDDYLFGNLIYSNSGEMIPLYILAIGNNPNPKEINNEGT